MNKPQVITHAYIITGGQDEHIRRAKAEALGREILAGVGQQVSTSTFMHIASEKSLAREHIAALLHDLSMTAFGGEYRVIVIVGAEKLTPEAANALLKSLEEPPQHVVFMLLTPTVARLIPTLRSRAQIVSAGTLGLDTVAIDSSEYHGFFSASLSERFAKIAQLSDRAEQQIFAEQLLRVSQELRYFTFAAWLQEKFVKAQKSGNLRLLLEASAVVAGGNQRV